MKSLVPTDGQLPEPAAQGDDSLLGPPELVTEPLADSWLRYLETNGMEDSADFERLIAQIAVHALRMRSAKKYGAHGQTQSGIDIVGVARDNTVWGFQAKRYQKFGPADLRAASWPHSCSRTEVVLT